MIEVYLNIYDRASGIPEAMAKPCPKNDLPIAMRMAMNLDSGVADKWVTGFDCRGRRMGPNKIIDVFETEREAKKSFWDKTESYFSAKLEEKLAELEF